LLRHVKILFIDDDPLGQELNKAIVSFRKDELCEEFSLRTIECLHTENLNVTVDLLNSSINENEFPHIILSDIQLIEATGFDFLDLFKREYIEDYPKTVVALITAFISDSDRDKLSIYPFCYKIFNRPLNKNTLSELIKEAIRRHS